MTNTHDRYLGQRSFLANHQYAHHLLWSSWKVFAGLSVINQVRQVGLHCSLEWADNAAELLSSDSLFFFLGFYIFSCQCFSSSILELLLIPASAILALSSCIALFYLLSQSFLTTWQFSWKFELRLCSWTISKLYQNYIKLSKTLNNIQLNP